MAKVAKRIGIADQSRQEFGYARLPRRLKTRLAKMGLDLNISGEALVTYLVCEGIGADPGKYLDGDLTPLQGKIAGLRKCETAAG